jgi:hypothetical protein
VASAAGISTGKRRTYSFKRPPRLARFRLWRWGVASARAGKRDGAQGVPDANDRKHPPQVQHLTELTNAWQHGPLLRRYRAERNRLGTERHHVVEQAEALAERLGSAPRLSDDDGFARAVLADGPSVAPPIPTEAPVRRGREQPVAGLSAFRYLALLLAIFACEGIINKKALELFSERDAVLWLMVSGLAVGIVLMSHLMGSSWRRYEDERKGFSILVVLILAGIAVSGVLGTLRYLTVDNQRQQQIETLQGQVKDAQGRLKQYGTTVQKPEELKKRGLTLEQQNNLFTSQSRRDEAGAELRANQSLLASARKARGIDRPEFGLPLFIFLNLFLVGVATALGYQHHDPERALIVAERRQRRREAFGAWLRTLRLRMQYRRDRRRERRQAKKLRKEADVQLATAKKDRAIAHAERAALEQLLGSLLAREKSLNDALDDLLRTYRSAAAEAEKLCEGIIHGRYWTAQNEAARTVPLKLKRAWQQATLKAVKKGHPLPPEPQGMEWVRPKAQDMPLAFDHPAEFA